MVVGNFPPQRDSAAVTAGKFARALLDEGWKVTVLARRQSGMPISALEKPINGLDGYYRFFGPGYQDFPSWAKWAVKNFCGFTPYCESALYLKNLRKAVGDVLEKHPVDLVLGAVGPVAIIPVLAGLHRDGMRKALWFFDPWTVSPAKFFRDFLQRRIYRRWEKGCLTDFDFLLFHSPELMWAYQQAFPEFTRKMHVLYNGFDPKEVQQAPSISPPADGFWLGYFGTVRQEEACALTRLMDALQQLPELQKSNFGFYLRGDFNKQGRITLHRRLSSGKRCFQWVVQESRAPLSRMLGEMRSCDLLLTSRSPALSLNPSGKIFWYLATGIPVLYIGPQGTAEANLILRANAGRVFSYDSPAEEIRDFLIEAVEAKEKGQSRFYPNREFIASLAVPVLARQFTHICSSR